MNRVPRWRLAAAALVLAGLVFFASVFAPIYFRDFQLRTFVTGLPQRAEAQAGSGAQPSDDVVRGWVLGKARELQLPVASGDIRITRSRDAAAKLERVAVRYFVKVDLPGYTVNLHFYPGAGSR